MTVLAVVLIVWTLVAFVVLVLARTLCAVAARADAEHAERTARRPVEAPRHSPVSTSTDPEPRVVVRTLRLALTTRATLRPMADTGKVAKNLRAFQMALNAHDRENPTHTAWGIGLAHFDMERLGFDEGEEILPGITIQSDGGVTGNFRVLCDGQHDEDLGDRGRGGRGVEAVGTQTVGAPGLRRASSAPRGPLSDPAASQGRRRLSPARPRSPRRRS